MKELIIEILSKEKELVSRAKDVEMQAQEIAKEAAKRFEIMEIEFENNFNAEKEKRINAVMQKSKDFEEILKRKSEQEIEEKKQKLIKKKDELKTKIIQMILGE